MDKKISGFSKVFLTFFIKSSQILLFVVFRPLGLLIIKSANVQLSASDIDARNHYLIVANHQAKSDPFFIVTNLPVEAYRNLWPIRFFAKNKLYDHPLLRPLMLLAGCFPAQSHKHGFGIGKAQSLLVENQAVFIFPEGKISINDREYRPRNGVSVLAQQPETLIIPARIKWYGNRWKRISVSIGRPFSGKHMTAEQIMDVVYSLKFR